MIRVQSRAGLRRHGITRGNDGSVLALACWLAVAAVTVWGCLSRPAEAAPNKPVISGSTATFTGDQHAGIVGSNVTQSAPSDFSTSSIYTVIINSLSSNITPASPYAAGIYVGYSGAKGKDGDSGAYDGDDGKGGESAKNLTLTYTGGSYLIAPSAGTPMDGIDLTGSGGAGGKGGQGNSGLAVTGHGGDGGSGGAGGALSLTSSGTIQTPSGNGISVTSSGGAGGEGGEAKAGTAATKGGSGGDGGNGNTVTVNSGSTITSSGNGIYALSAGGAGGTGGDAKTGSKGTGGNGGDGGAGGTVTVSSSGILTSSGTGIYAASTGGLGGAGGMGGGTDGEGGNGHAGGAGGQVTVTSTGAVTATGNGHGIYALSQGGTGGEGGEGDGVGGIGHDGGSGAAGGAVSVSNNGAITAHGSNYHGIYALSRGGTGGEGGEGNGVGGVGGDGGSGGAGGAASVTNQAGITTSGTQSQGIMAASLGGAGGDGGQGDGMVGIGGAAKGSGPGGQVTVGNSGALQTSGDTSRGIFAQSVGGFAGSGGGSGGLFSYGADGNSGGPGGNVTITNTGGITTSGADSEAIFAQSVGGGGGSGGSSGGVFTMGGSGNAGGNGGTVSVTNSGKLQTSKDNADGVFAQSIGGGGGDGGGVITGSLLVSVALGGQAGTGGSGGGVSVGSSNNIDTTGANAVGIHAQSAGGGGGTGGYAISAAANGVFSCSVAMGGSGGSGGSGGTVNVTGSSDIHTQGDNAYGIFAESLGGGGGSGGYSISASASPGYSAAVSLGGSGGSGGGGQKVEVETTGGSITTTGVNADGILAQSVGGGGGAAGYAASGSLGATGSFALSLGGTGGSGGAGGEVDVTNAGAILTSGKTASGILAQSVGGGGGAASYNMSASLGLVTGSVGLGGTGGPGGTGGTVNVTNNSAVTTGGELAYGILAQSIGGGGGTGGYSLSADVGVGALGFSLGGSGTAGGTGGVVTVDNHGAVATGAGGSHGILAQSVGGGGGAGGWAGTGAMSFGVQAGDITVPSLSLAVAVGGKGGAGSSSQTVTVLNTAGITTAMEGSDGILAQSIGGGGGDGGWATSAAINFSAGKTYSAALSVALGGTAGSGGAGGGVVVTNQGAIQTAQENSPGILAQSVGGGGGTGGLSAAVTMEGSTPSASTLNSSVSIGGTGGGGGSSSQVSVTSSAPVVTGGDASPGIEAQSIGGGGGNGGTSLSGELGLSNKNVQLQVSVGGSGATGGDAGAVTLQSGGNVTTHGDQSEGILAQSIGGGGGNGGMSFDGEIAINQAKSLAVSIGGSGGKGGNGAGVQVTTTGGVITTSGEDAHGIFAQSVGGGGGMGNLGGSGVLNFYGTEEYGVNLSVNVGGNGGVAGTGGSVTVKGNAGITTSGDNSCAIFAQSVGGGGGEAGGGFTGHINTEVPESGFNWELGVSVGGHGGNGNNGGSVEVDNQGTLVTAGYQAHGVFAQSVGGGGGAGGDAKDFTLVFSDQTITPEHITSLAVSVGGSGGGSSDGGNVTVTNQGAVTTQGEYAKGIFAQSVGGGGGEGGSNKGYSLRETLFPGTLGVTVGGGAGSSGNGGAVSVTNSGAIATAGEGSYGIQAQSVGGGGGEGGEGEVGLLKPAIGIGGAAGAGGNGGTVTVANSGGIATSGDGAHGIFAQSVGGGGGTAGNVARFLPEYADIGIGIGWAPGGGAGGDGGQVSVSNTSNITTHGASAYGIMAQSVGGGGGEAGEVGYGPGTGVNYLLGSVGYAGSGGGVSVSHSGAITTTGDDSAGIFAQSAGGEGTGGSVTITVGGNVLSSGANSAGIQAQSTGQAGNGDIAVTINSGTVQGGVGGAGVVFMDGNSNTLTNYGAITTLDGANGTAVQQSGAGGILTVNNSGTITGSVNQGGRTSSSDPRFKIAQGAGAVNFTNNRGALFNAGSTVNLGSGTLTNNGTVNLGTSQSNLTGNFTQSDSGIVTAVLNGDGTGGSLKVSGTATLSGALKWLPGSGAFRKGVRYTLLTSDRPITTQFAVIDLPGSSLVSFSTNYTSNALEVESSVRSFTTVATNPHYLMLARNLDAVASVAAGGFGQALREIQLMDGSGYDRAFESLSPGIYDAATTTTFDITRQYIRALQQRLQVARENLRPRGAGLPGDASPPVMPAHNGSAQQSKGGQDASLYRKPGMWIQGFGQWADQNPVDGISGYDYSMGGTAVGLDYAFGDRLAVGANFGYAYTSLGQDNGFADGTLNSYFVSLCGAWFGDRAYLEGVLSYGNHNYDNSRTVSIDSMPTRAGSDHHGNGFSAFLEGGYALPVEKWAVQPLVSVLYSYLDESGFMEAGANALNMMVGRRRTDAVVTEAGVRLSRPISTSMGILAPEVKATWQHNFDPDSRTIPVTFAGVPLGLNIDGRKPGQDSAAINAGFSFTGKGGVTTSLKYDAVLRGGYTAQSVMGYIQLEF